MKGNKKFEYEFRSVTTIRLALLMVRYSELTSGEHETEKVIQYKKKIRSVKTVEVSNQIKIHSHVVCCDRANRMLGFIAQLYF